MEMLCYLMGGVGGNASAAAYMIQCIGGCGAAGISDALNDGRWSRHWSCVSDIGRRAEHMMTTAMAEGDQ